MLSDFLKNPFFRFILFSTAIYIGWYVSYEYYLKPNTVFDEFIIDGLVRTGEGLMNFFGYELTDYAAIDGDCRSHIGILGSKGVTIGAPCDGAVLYALFLCFVVAFPGSSKHKYWFVPLGVATIFLINALRVIGLAIIVDINENWLSFNHDYTFTFLVYAYVFWLWWLWVKKFSNRVEISEAQK